MLGAISSAIGGAVDSAKSAVSGAASAVSGAVSGAAKAVSGAVSGASKSVSSAASGASKTVSAAASGASKTVSGAGASVNQQVKNSASQVLSSQSVDNAQKQLVNTFKSQDNVMDFVTKNKAVDTLKSVTTSPLGTNVEKAAKRVGEMGKIGNIGGLANVGNKVGDTVEHLADHTGKAGIPISVGKVLPSLLNPGTGGIEKVADLGKVSYGIGHSLEGTTAMLSKTARGLGPVGAVVAAGATLLNPGSSLKDKFTSVGNIAPSLATTFEHKGAGLIKDAQASSEFITKNPLASGLLKTSENGGKLVVNDPGVLSKTMEHAGEIQSTSKLGGILSSVSKILSVAGPAVGGVAAVLEFNQANEDEKAGHKFAARQGKVNAIGDGIMAVGSGIGGIPGLALMGLGAEVRFRPSDDPAIMQKPRNDETDVASQVSLADYYGANHGLSYDYDADHWINGTSQTTASGQNKTLLQMLGL